MNSRIAIVAALEREITHLTRNSTRVEREHAGRRFVFFEQDETVIVCGGIGVESSRRAAEAIIAFYQPALMQSVGFAGALGPNLHVGDIFVPAVVIDARDGSRIEVENGEGTLLTFMSVAGAEQKASLAQAYGAQAVDMEAAGVAAAARAHGIQFAATKAISDGLDFEMPETTCFVDSQGRFKTASFTAFVALRPWLWGRVFKLARNSARAAKNLGGHLKSCSRTYHDVVEAKTT